MKKKSLELKEKRGDIQAKLKAILDKASDEKRNVTDAELADVRDLSQQRDALDAQIETAELLEREQLRIEQDAANEARANGSFNIGTPQNRNGAEGEKSRMRKSYRMLRVIASQIPDSGVKLDGVEAELVQEGRSEAAKKGIIPSGVPLPSFLVGEARYSGLAEKKEMRADLTVGTTATAGALVETSIREVIEYLYPETVLVPAGARILSGLTGNVNLVRKNGAGSMAWEGENTDADQTNPTFENVSLTPKRGAAFEVYGKQLMLQTDVLSVENMVREDIMLAVGQGLESAGIQGATGGNNPVGILNISGIGSVAMGTDGGVPTWPKIVELETTVANANALRGALAYITTPGIAGLLKSTPKAGTFPIFIMENGMVNGYKMFTSTLVPSTLDKGTTNDACHAIIFGNFRELYIGQWGGLDVVVDPYSLAGKAQVKITVNSWWDVAVRHTQSFAAIKDATLS